MDYHEYLKTRQLLKEIYHNIGAARKSGDVRTLAHIQNTVYEWFRSINNPKLYYVYEPHEYLSNPHLVRLRKEFPDILRLVELAKKDITYKANKAARKLEKHDEPVEKEVKDAADRPIEEEI